jgi:hypothetical protein
MKTRIQPAHISSVILNACWYNTRMNVVEEIQVNSVFFRIRVFEIWCCVWLVPETSIIRTSLPRRLEPSTTPVLEPQISHFLADLEIINKRLRRR